MSVHQGSVDSYLQNIFDKTIDKSSSMQAFQEAKLKAETLNKFIDKVESKKNKPEVLIKDLVSSFLIPDVERKQVQKQLQFEEKRFLEAARKTIMTSVEEAGRRLESEQFKDMKEKDDSD
jgi:RNA polymerase-interacting CarD/CdnL/TRCF family regulator